jgi:hypothetical protein
MLQGVRPAQYTFDARRIRRDNANGRKSHTDFTDAFVHRFKPFVGHLARTGPHVRNHNGRAFVENIDEGIETFRGMNIYLAGLVPKVVCETATRFILSIQIEQRVRNLIRIEPLDQAGGESGFTHPAFPSFSENHPA